MGTFLKIAAVLVLAAGIFGGSAYFAYELFWKPKKLEAQEKQEAEIAASQPPPPHPTLAQLEQAQAALAAGNTDAARPLLEAILEEETSPVRGEARRLLGELNIAELFSPVPSEHKTPYTVVRGDALAKIASRTGSGAELIYRINGLSTINLQIGQQLLIPKLDIKARVHREQRVLTLENHGKFLKDYPLVGATVPGLAPSAHLEARVADKIATKDGRRVAFGDKSYFEAERLILLSPGSATIRAMPQGAETPPPGIVLSPEDLEEVFVLVSRGTPFTIE